jgi:hypothetical protein
MRRGVSIVEVLFAMGIVSVGLLGVLSALVVSGHRMSRGTVIDGATKLAAAADREFRTRGYAQTVGWTAAVTLGQAYCLDPLGVAELGTGTPAKWFPAIDPATVPGPRMNRVSLRKPAPAVGPITTAVADGLFRDRDSLIFDAPDDRTLPPVTRMDGGQRATEGALSWFATIETKQRTREAVLNIVVCSRRDHAAADLLCDVTAIEAGSVTIKPRTGQPTTDAEIKSGEWLLLIGRDGWNIDHYAWQRVVHAPTADQPERELSIQGQDWPLTAAQTKAVIVDGVVIVAERTITLEVQP